MTTADCGEGESDNFQGSSSMMLSKFKRLRGCSRYSGTRSDINTQLWELSERLSVTFRGYQSKSKAVYGYNPRAWSVEDIGVNGQEEEDARITR